jgi:thiamine-phosphate pyrophosphorylase
LSALPRFGSARIAGLYAITPDLADTDLLVALVDAAIDGGATVVQYRHKDADPALRATQAALLAGTCRARGVPFIVNDHVDVALALDDAGLHVGADDSDDLAALRARLGPRRLLGVSCYRSVERAHAAIASGADYVAFGSVFASTTKPAAPGVELALFGRARSLGVPLVGSGGISIDNVAALVAAGADAAAVISALFESHDPARVREQARAFAHAFSR